MNLPKPWERAAISQRNAEQNSTEGVRWNSSFVGGGDLGTASTGIAAGGGIQPNAPPPLPPRPITNPLSSNNYYNSNYGTGFGSAMNPYYGYGGASASFSPYGYGGVGGYNRMPYSSYYGGSPENGDFVRLAEEQSRGAFQSIESIVQAFSSVSMMLESSLNAIHSSFRAVLGVADQFSRLKLQTSQILASLAVVRFLRWLWRRVLIVLRLRPATGNSEELWRQMMGDAPQTAAQILSAHGAGKTGSQWPGLVFFAFVIGGPYLIWKLVSKLVASVEDQKRWATGERSHFVAVALYDFEGSSNGELSVRAGQRLRLAPKELQPSVRGWILGSVDGSTVGLVPANYIKIIGKQNVGENAAWSAQSTSNEATDGTVISSTAVNETSEFEKLFSESN